MPKLTNGMSVAEKRRLAVRWHKEGKTQVEIAKLLGVSFQRVSQLLKEDSNVEQVLKDDESEEGLNEAYIRARTEYTKTQNVKLQRQLSLDADQLIRREHLEEVIKSMLRHSKAFGDWIRKQRTGDVELLEAHKALIHASLKEIEHNGWVEGKDIDIE